MATRKNAIVNYEQQFYLSGIQLSGVTSLNGSYSINESPINIIGKGYTYPTRYAPMVGNFSISKYYIGQEPLFSYTGDGHISGSINFEDKSFGFESGYLTDYSINCSIGSIPNSTANIIVYGDIGAGISASGTNPHPTIQIPNQGSISLNATGYESNRITDFNYSLRVDRSPIYKAGSPYPIQVDRKFPLVQQASFTVEVNDYEIAKVRDYLIKPKQQDISIVFKNPINDNSIETFTLKKARLLSQSISSTSDGLMKVQLNYSSYINKK